MSGNDIRHRFVWSSIYELPFGHGRRWAAQSRQSDLLVGGWSLGVIAEARTGTPLRPLELVNNTNSFSDGVRPNVAGDPNLTGDRGRADQLAQWFKLNAFAAPAGYTFGNAGRTFGTGPGLLSIDGSLLKNMAITESKTLQFRIEALNVLNHANFANPDTRRGSATFGQITTLVSGNPARILQLGAHFKF